MQVTIRQKRGKWAVKVDEKLIVLELPTDRVRLIDLVKAIYTKHPRATVQLDEEIQSQNPFIKRALAVGRSAGTQVDWQGMQTALETPRALTCTHCGGPTWYDPLLNSHHCLKCNGWGSAIRSNLDYTTSSGGWGDDDALTPKPTTPCSNGHFNPGWYKHGYHWICRDCGERYRGSAYKAPPYEPSKTEEDEIPF